MASSLREARGGTEEHLDLTRPDPTRPDVTATFLVSLDDITYAFLGLLGEEVFLFLFFCFFGWTTE